jgi:hypothetical protein
MSEQAPKQALAPFALAFPAQICVSEGNWRDCLNRTALPKPSRIGTQPGGARLEHRPLSGKFTVLPLFAHPHKTIENNCIEKWDAVAENREARKKEKKRKSNPRASDPPGGVDQQHGGLCKITPGRGQDWPSTKIHENSVRSVPLKNEHCTAK